MKPKPTKPCVKCGVAVPNPLNYKWVEMVCDNCSSKWYAHTLTPAEQLKKDARDKKREEKTKFHGDTE